MSITTKNKKKKAKDTTKWFCSFNINWADEINFNLYGLYSAAQKKKLVEFLQDHKDEMQQINFGTNEEDEYTGNDILESISWTKIDSPMVLKFIKKHMFSTTIPELEYILSSDYIDDNIDYFKYTIISAYYIIKIHLTR